ncbi:hypothetical protein [Pelagimonas varians]|uniref:Lysozyme inhibitor LprI N-terminal domain-containing protein n=1 Tax=Pelagimonas varians TaxID=696760 RepID=A0A238KUV2_9RHOB|nr:hypothetical protein [Pelagimonas varians]PYG28301.1 hypothetical protein C8N36_11276 [Pelagimonas varians]SMX46420.1 hypothetical protein PEV8663_03278 [Pelagimonas varians]
MNRKMAGYLAPAVMALVLTSQPVAAEVDLGKVDGCISNARDLDLSPLSCVDAAHAQCLEIHSETPNVISLCFSRAQDSWSQGIARHMDVLTEQAPAEIVTIAKIEVKYDLLASLLQCDRMDELSALQGTPEEERLMQKTRCSATASGLAFARMIWRSPMRQN